MLNLVYELEELNKLLDSNESSGYGRVLLQKKKIFNICISNLLDKIDFNEKQNPIEHSSFNALKISNFSLIVNDENDNELKEYETFIEFIIPKSKRTNNINSKIGVVISYKNKKILLLPYKQKIEVIEDKKTYLEHIIIDNGTVKTTISDSTFEEWSKISIYYRNQNILKVISKTSEYANVKVYEGNTENKEIGFGIADLKSNSRHFFLNDYKILTLYKNKEPIKLVKKTFSEGNVHYSRIACFKKTVEDMLEKTYRNGDKMPTKELFATENEIYDFLKIAEIKYAI